MLAHHDLTERIIGLAIEVHRHTGPDFSNLFTRNFWAWNCARPASNFKTRSPCRLFTKEPHFRSASVPIWWSKTPIILEIKAVTSFVPAHEAQILTYLRMSNIRIGLLMNFHAPRLKDGLRRFIV